MSVWQQGPSAPAANELESSINSAPKSLQLYRIKQHILYQELDRLVFQSTRGSFYTTENRVKIYKMMLNFTSSGQLASKRDGLLSLTTTVKQPGSPASSRGATELDDIQHRSQSKLTLDCLNQIQLDVNRTFGSESVCSSDRLIIRDNLANLLSYFFKNYGDWLSYYQVEAL